MQGKYRFWTGVLACLLAGLAITSFLIPPVDGVEDWIPLLSGFADLAAFKDNLLFRGILGVAFNFLIALSLLVINTKSVNNVFYPNFSVAFFLLIILLNPGAVYFSCVHPAVLLFVWGQFCFIINQKFTSMFLLSCAALFYAPLLWVLPLVLVISVTGAADMLRVAIKSLGGILLPLLYVLCFRYMAYSDAAVFVQEYLQHSMAFSTPFHNAGFTSIFVVICLAATALHSISYMVQRLHKNSIITAHILKMELMSVVLGTALFFLFGGNAGVPANMLVALPLAILFSHYFTGNITAAPARAELILLCSAAAVARLYHFI